MHGIKLDSFDKRVYEALEMFEVVNVEALAIKLAVPKYKLLWTFHKLEKLKLCIIWSENKVKLNKKWI